MCIKPYDVQVMGTKERLLATAEELYGGQGIDAVSLREICLLYTSDAADE